MKQDAIHLFTTARKAFAALCPLVEKATSRVKSERDLKELADCAFAMRETHALLDRLRKDVKALQELAEKMTCLLYTTQSNSLSDEAIRTSFCTATPDVGLMASLPKKSKDPEGFAAMMRHMGVPDDLWNAPDSDDEVVRPHWPGMVAYLTKCAQEGRSLPPGIEPEKTYPVYKLSIRKKRDIMELDEKALLTMLNSSQEPKEEETTPF